MHAAQASSYINKHNAYLWSSGIPFQQLMLEIRQSALQLVLVVKRGEMQLYVKCTVLHVNHVGKDLHQSDVDDRLVIRPLISNIILRRF